MQQHRGYWITGRAVPGPPNTSYWESLGTVLKSGHSGSVIEVARQRDTGVTFDMKQLAEWYGLELCQLAVGAFLSPH